MTRVIVLAAIGSVALVATALGAVPRNGLVGVRTKDTMRSDHAWAVGHRAARLWLLGSAVGLGATALATWSAEEFSRTSTVALACAMGLLAVGAVVAHRAARRVEGFGSGGRVGLRHITPRKWHLRPGDGQRD